MTTIDLLKTVADLIRLPSVNPMGRTVQPEIHFEHRVTAYLQQLFEDLGVPFERQTLAPGRDNIVARLDGAIPQERGGKLVMFEAHQDTVPVDGMIIPPFEPRMGSGRVYGRGACDIKGGMASMLWAFSRLATERPSGMPSVVMACSVNEEHGVDGATKLAELWSSPNSILHRRPDMAIVAEPTMLDVVVAHKGVVRWRMRTHGRAVHSSRPEQGENAVFKMAHLLKALEHYAQTVVPGLGNDRWVGNPTLSVGLISGGISVNTVPDECVIEVDRRLLPSENPWEAFHHALKYCEQAVDTTITHERPFAEAFGLSDELNGALAESLGNVAKPFGGGQRIGVPFGTNAPPYAMTGVPTVVFGPGSINQAHTNDEWVAVEQLQSAGEILFNFACNIE